MTGENLLTLEGHTSYVESVAFSPDGQHLVSGSRDHTVKMWNIAGHTGGVYSIAFNPDLQSQMIATASGDHTAKLWDISTGTPRMLRALTGRDGHKDTVYRLAFDPKGERIATASFDRSAILWDVKTGRRLHTFRCHEDQLRDVTFSPDGQNLATGSADGTARLYSLGDIDRRPDIDCSSVLVRHSKSEKVVQVSAVAFHPHDKRWVTGGWDGALRRWDFEGKFIDEIPAKAYGAKPPRIVDLAFVRKGTELAALGGKTVYFWPLSAFGREDVEPAPEPTRKVSVEGPLYCDSMAFSQDEKQLAVACNDETVRIYDAGTLALAKTIHVHTDSVTGVAFSPDGSKLATASLDKTFHVSPLVFQDLYKLAKQVQAARSGETATGETPLQ
jgi:WD40 repeat protein